MLVRPDFYFYVYGGVAEPADVEGLLTQCFANMEQASLHPPQSFQAC